MATRPSSNAITKIALMIRFMFILRTFPCRNFPFEKFYQIFPQMSIHNPPFPSPPCHFVPAVGSGYIRSVGTHICVPYAQPSFPFPCHCEGNLLPVAPKRKARGSALGAQSHVTSAPPGRGITPPLRTHSINGDPSTPLGMTPQERHLLIFNF